MNEQTLSLIRSALKVVGTYLVTKGIVKDDSTVEVIVGGLITLMGVVAGFLKARGADNGKAAADVPVKRIGSNLFLLALILPLCASCAYMRSTTQSFDLAGNPTGKTTAVAYALFDSNASFTKFRNQSDRSGSTNNQFAPGTYVASGEVANSTSNAVVLVQALGNLLLSMPK
jgi:hypothetical protein